MNECQGILMDFCRSSHEVCLLRNSLASICPIPNGFAACSCLNLSPGVFFFLWCFLVESREHCRFIRTSGCSSHPPFPACRLTRQHRPIQTDSLCYLFFHRLMVRFDLYITASDMLAGRNVPALLGQGG